MAQRQFDNDNLVYAGDNEQCRACGQDKLEWNDHLMCVVCDNPSTGEGTWFVAWSHTLPGDFDG